LTLLKASRGRAQMDYMQLGLVLGIYQGLKYGDKGFDKLARFRPPI
jgi:hypothetical protein